MQTLDRLAGAICGIGLLWLSWSLTMPFPARDPIA
jgi:hypothetical protein